MIYSARNCCYSRIAIKIVHEMKRKWIFIALLFFLSLSLFLSPRQMLQCYTRYNKYVYIFKLRWEMQNTKKKMQKFVRVFKQDSSYSTCRRAIFAQTNENKIKHQKQVYGRDSPALSVFKSFICTCKSLALILHTQRGRILGRSFYFYYFFILNIQIEKWVCLRKIVYDK